MHWRLSTKARLLVTALVAVPAVALAQNTVPVLAVQAKPATDWSFYVRTTNATTLYNLGCNQGNFDRNSGNINSEVILDFGGQASNNGGTYLTGSNAYVSYGTVENLAEQFAKAYYICTGSDLTSVLKLGIGTNNSAYYVNSSGGTAWANVVKAVRSWVSSNGYSSQVNIGGANDIEPSWHNYPDTKAWVDAFGNNGGSWYLNYGSADGCPQSSHTNGGCNNGWNQDDVWYVSWGAAPAYATPEIYYQSQANQWGQIKQWKGMGFEGPLDEYDLATSTFTAGAAWNALWNAIQQNMTFSLEIHVAS